MELRSFKNISEQDSFLHLIDGRVKTVIFLGAIIVGTCLARWYLVSILWMLSIAMFPVLHLPLGTLLKRLMMPFGIAWLVFLSLIFTNGSEPLLVFNIFHVSITAYHEGLTLGFLILLRIMTTVTLASILSFSTPMIEILETLRLCKIPTIIIDLAAMMYRYVFIIEETAHNMRRAQLSRMSSNNSWLMQARDVGNVAGYVLIKSLDRSIKIYNAMLSRGYNENSTNVEFFVTKVSSEDWRYGILSTFVLVILVIINIVV